MAAILTPTNLTVLDHSTLKHPSSTIEQTCPLPPLPTCLAWSAETNSVYISATSGILQYDLTTESLQDVSTHHQPSDPPVSLLTKDRGNTIICASGQKVTVLSAQSGKTVHTFDTHKATITSLSLSNDSTLLASTSAHAIHVHNLTLASHTVLRGLPTGSGTISTCAFHPHSRTRLLVGLESQLLVYDTTRPSGPAKIIPIDKEKKNVGSIVSISCSPFSKTLVAVACSGGTVALVDLEKERGPFRSVLMSAPLTCLSFSPEGAAVYAGTENGKFLILDLRALDKPPKTITVSENGDQIIAISVQKKLKPGEAQGLKPAAATTASKPLVQRDTNKAAPAARRVGSSTTLNAVKQAAEDKVATKKPSIPSSTTPARQTTVRPVSNPANGSPAPRLAAAGVRRLNTGAVKSPAAMRSEVQKKAFSPPRSPVILADKNGAEEEQSDLSVRVENLLALPRAKESAVPAAATDEGDDPITTVPARAPSALSRRSSRTQISEIQRPRDRTRTESAPRAPTAATLQSQSQSASAVLPRMRSASSSASLASRASRTSVASTRRVVSQSSSGSRSSSSASPPAGAVQQARRRVSGSSVASRLSRTPSPDLPGMEDDGGPVTPIPAYKLKGKARAQAALGVGTPELDQWVKAGEGMGAQAQGGKRVGFAGDNASDDDEAEEIARAENSDEDEELDAPRGPTRMGAHLDARLPRAELAMQVSPRRSFAGGPSSSRAGAWAPVPSPLRNPAAPPSPQARAAQDMLQALLRDALHDFRQETKAEIVGLHLDLIRMGTGWRTEMREAMGDFAEEMRELREENRRLREENERLRRGY